MEAKPKLIEDMVQEIKGEVFGPSSTILPYLSSSAYDTVQPMGRRVLGGASLPPDPTLDCITTTLICLVALKTWNVGTQNIKQGLQFLHAKMKKLLTDYDYAAANQQLEWFAIVFPGMLELAQAKGLMILPEKCTSMVNHLFHERERILERMSKSSWGTNLLLDLYFEALPASYMKKHEAMIRQRGCDGMMLRPPAATACAFITTKDESWLLDSLPIPIQTPTGLKFHTV